MRNKPQTAKQNVSFHSCFIQFCYFGWLGFKGKTTSHHCSLFVRSRYFYSKCMIERKRVVNSFISFLFYFFFNFHRSLFVELSCCKRCMCRSYMFVFSLPVLRVDNTKQIFKFVDDLLLTLLYFLQVQLLSFQVIPLESLV